MTDKKEDLDDLINFFLHKFTEDSLFKSSAEHWLSSGRPSGSFRESLHAMLESWASKRNTFSKNEIEGLKAHLSSKEHAINELIITSNQRFQRIEVLEQECDQFKSQIEALHAENKDSEKELVSVIESLRAERDELKKEVWKQKDMVTAREEEVHRICKQSNADIEALRAENERLKDWNKLLIEDLSESKEELKDKTLETQVANTSIDLLNSELNVLRKRCEDLEAALKRVFQLNGAAREHISNEFFEDINKLFSQ